MKDTAKRTQHLPWCRGYLADRTPWRPFHCHECNAIERTRDALTTAASQPGQTSRKDT